MSQREQHEAQAQSVLLANAQTGVLHECANLGTAPWLLTEEFGELYSMIGEAEPSLRPKYAGNLLKALLLVGPMVERHHPFAGPESDLPPDCFSLRRKLPQQCLSILEMPKLSSSKTKQLVCR